MSRRLVFCLACFVNLAAFAAQAETLPLPAGLTDLNSDQGEKFLLESRALKAFFPISSNFVTQKTQAYCGVASIVMVLNALGAPAPTTPEYQPYRIFTQDNLLDATTDAILPRDVLARQGMTLDQLGALLALHPPLKVEVRHAAAGGLAAFRAAASAYLGQNGRFVVVNYLRKAIQQQTGGHISPLGAYDAATDRFLILDVARYKYPPVWVKAVDLFDAMNTPDAANGGQMRGYVLIAGDGATP